MQNSSNNTIQTFWVALGSLSSFLVSILSAAILARYFNKVEYGTYRQVLYVYNTLLVVFTAGLPRVFEYFLPRFPIEQGKSIVWKVSKMLFFLGVVFSLALFLFAGLIARLLKNPELEIGLKYFALIPMLLLPTLGIEGIFASYKRTSFIAFYNIITKTLMLLFIVAPVILFNGSYISAIKGWIVVSVISLLIAVYFKGIPFKKIKTVKTSLQFKTIFSYSLPLVLASISGVALLSADQFYISRFFGTEIFAEFINGFIDIPFVSMINSAVAVVITPVFSKIIYEENKTDELMYIWRNSIHKSALLIYPIVMYFIFYSYEIMITLYSTKYAISGKYFQINMILNFFTTITFAPFFLSSGRTKLYFLVHFIYAVIIWITHYFVIMLFNEPIWVAANGVIIRIALIVTFVLLAADILKVRVNNFLPFETIIKIILQTTLIVLFTKFIQYYFFGSFSILLQLVFTLIIYLAFLFLTSNLFKINYFQVIKPLVKKF